METNSTNVQLDVGMYSREGRTCVFCPCCGVAADKLYACDICFGKHFNKMPVELSEIEKVPEARDWLFRVACSMARGWCPDCTANPCDCGSYIWGFYERVGDNAPSWNAMGHTCGGADRAYAVTYRASALAACSPELSFGPVQRNTFGPPPHGPWERKNPPKRRGTVKQKVAVAAETTVDGVKVNFVGPELVFKDEEDLAHAIFDREWFLDACEHAEVDKEKEDPSQLSPEETARVLRVLNIMWAGKDEEKTGQKDGARSRVERRTKQLLALRKLRASRE